MPLVVLSGCLGRPSRGGFAAPEQQHQAAMALVLGQALAFAAVAHTQMNWPPPWQDVEQVGNGPGWRHVGCTSTMVPSGTKKTTTGHTSMTPCAPLPLPPDLLVAQATHSASSLPERHCALVRGLEGNARAVPLLEPACMPLGKVVCHCAPLTERTAQDRLCVHAVYQLDLHPCAPISLPRRQAFHAAR